MSMFSNRGERAALRAQQQLEKSANQATNEINSGTDAAKNQLLIALENSQGLLNPYQKVGEDALSRLNLLSDPTAQQDYLNNNPLLQQSIQNANTAIGSSAASRGRLTAGDTQTALVNSTAGLQNQFLNQEQQKIMAQLGFGAGVAGQQSSNIMNTGANSANFDFSKSQMLANLLTDVGSSKANTTIGIANAKDAQTDQTAQLIGSIAMMFSDIRLKTNIKEVGTIKGFKKYSWNWNEKAKKLGLFGKSEGVIAQEVEKTHPNLVIEDVSGYKKVKYGEM